MELKHGRSSGRINKSPHTPDQMENTNNDFTLPVIGNNAFEATEKSHQDGRN